MQQLAQTVGLPRLREYVIGTFVVLYAHSDSDVVLLSLTHLRHLNDVTRQSTWPPESAFAEPATVFDLLLHDAILSNTMYLIAEHAYCTRATGGFVISVLV